MATIVVIVSQGKPIPFLAIIIATVTIIVIIVEDFKVIRTFSKAKGATSLRFAMIMAIAGIVIITTKVIVATITTIVIVAIVIRIASKFSFINSTNLIEGFDSSSYSKPTSIIDFLTTAIIRLQDFIAYTTFRDCTFSIKFKD